MQFVPEGSRLPPPFLCFICETSPQVEEGQKVVDTLQNFEPAFPHGLTGRKLVCERCVKSMGALFGMRTTDEVDRARHAIQDARDKFLPLQGVLRSLSTDIVAQLEHLSNLPVVEGAPSPAMEDKLKKEREQE